MNPEFEDKEFEDKEFQDELSTPEAEKEKEKYKQKIIPLPFTIKLQFPFQFGKDETIEEIVIKRRLQTKDVMNIPAENLMLGHMVKLISKCSIEPMGKIERLDTIDMFECMEVIKTFLPLSRKTGQD